MGLAVVSATQIVGDLHQYLFVWTSAAAVTGVLAAAVAAAARWPALRFVSVGALAVLGLLLGRQFAGDDGAAYRTATGVTDLSREADRALGEAGADDVLVDIVGGGAWPKAAGIAWRWSGTGTTCTSSGGWPSCSTRRSPPRGRRMPAWWSTRCDGARRGGRSPGRRW